MFEEILCRRRPRISTLGVALGRTQKSIGQKTPHGVWYRALRATGMPPRGPYTMRHPFISIGLSNGVNIKWLAEYCGTSVAMIEKHYGKYIRNHVYAQLARILGGKSETLEGDKGEKTGADWGKI